MDTPTLEGMGIRNASSITRYKLKQKGADKDQLDIYYKRETGSLLPTRRTYEFGRSKSTAVSDSSSTRIEDRYEVSPVLLTAVNELNTLLRDGNAQADQQELMLMELEGLKRLVKAGEAQQTIKEKLEQLVKTL